MKASILAALLLSAPHAFAGTVLVTNANDAGAGSLRAAIAAAQAFDTVTFDPSLQGATITLTSGEIAVDKAIVLQGLPGIEISGNRASRIFHVASGGTLSVYDLTLRDGFVNNFGDGGGALVDDGGKLYLTRSTVRDCRAGTGGGVAVYGLLLLDASTLSANSADLGGAIVAVLSASVSTTNSTISGNAAGSGGGILVATGATLTATSSTIASNVAHNGFGGGIYANETAGAASLENSLLGGNRATVGGPDCSGALASLDYNLLQDPSGCTVTGATSHNVTGLSPRLGSLQRNGGRTRTHALLAGSPAIDAGTCAAAVDQRGAARPADGDAAGAVACDIGAYEAARPIVVTSLASAGDGTTCTLAQAVAAANTNAAVGACAPGSADLAIPDRITFAVQGTITGSFALSQSVMLEGPGADRLTLSGGGSGVVVAANNASGANTFVVSGLTIANGKAGSNTGAGLQFHDTTGGLDDTLAVDACEFRDNYAGAGGAILFARQAAGTELSRSTFRNAHAGATGFAGIELGDVAAEMTSCTVADTYSQAAVSFYTGVSTTTRTLRITASTVSGPESVGIQATTLASAGTAIVEVACSIVAGHATSFGSSSGSFVSRGQNVVFPDGGLGGDQDIVADPLLGVLAYNGGGVRTLNLQPGSPAIGHASTLKIPFSTTDARGFTRTGAPFDSGAVERVTGGDVNGDRAINVSDVFYLINFLFAQGPVPVGESDLNGDGAISVADVFFLINLLFAGGPPPV